MVARPALLMVLAITGLGCEGNVNNGDGVGFAATIRASVANGGDESAFPSAFPTITSDGRYVCFVSISDTMHPDDDDILPDIYVRDLVEGTTTLISRENGAAGTKGNNKSDSPRITPDGKFVVYSSQSTNLHVDDADTFPDIYIRNMVTQTNILASRATGLPGVKIAGGCEWPGISDDGTCVVFRTFDGTLDPADPVGDPDVYARNLTTGDTLFISRDSGPAGVGSDSGAEGGVISGDGLVVAFTSYASNIGGGSADNNSNVYIRDWQAASPVTTLVSRATGPAGSKATLDCEAPALSADGRYVVFESDSNELFEPDPDYSESGTDIFMRDTLLEVTTVISVNSDGVQALEPGFSGTSGSNKAAAVSPDGRFVSFSSVCSNLIGDDMNNARDIFIRDVVLGTTILVSVRTFGNPSNNSSDNSAITPDGRFVAFDSVAANLVDDDSNGVSDIFVRGPLD